MTAATLDAQPPAWDDPDAAGGRVPAQRRPVLAAVPDPAAEPVRPPADRVRVFVDTDDPIAAAGAAVQLRQRPGLELVGPRESEGGARGVAVVVAAQADEAVVARCRTLLRTRGCRIVLLVTRMREADLLRVVECGVSTVLWRRDVTPERLHAAVLGAHRGDGSMPPELLGRLVAQVGAMHRDDLGTARRGGLTSRETEVLKLVAEGLATGEIAAKLNYSERTIKSILQGVMSRLHLRNRAHAVAYALREGYL